MTILVVDAQGGGLGKQLTAVLRKKIDAEGLPVTLRAAGTNSTAAAVMKKAGADIAASGENAVIVAARDADVILGPIGIVIADSLFGEITASMAAAIGKSRAVRILIPLNKCETIVVGTRTEGGLSACIEEACEEALKIVRVGKLTGGSSGC